MCCNCGSCCVLPLIGSLILGILLAVFGAAPLTIALIGAGVAIVLFFLVFITLLKVDRRDEEVRVCICKNFPCLIAGIVLSLIAAVFIGVLGITSAIATFFAGWFLFLTVLSTLAFLLCLIKGLCNLCN